MSVTASSAFNLRTVAAMTSWPPRINSVASVIDSVFAGNVIPDGMFLTLSVAEFPGKEADLPDNLKSAIARHGVKLLWESRNTYTFKKLLPPARELRKRGELGTLIWTIDDDFLYHKNTLSEMLKSYAGRPGCLVAGVHGGGACRLICGRDIPGQMLEEIPDDICATRLDDTWTDEFLRRAGVEEIVCGTFMGRENRYGDALSGAHPASEVYLNGLAEKNALIVRYISAKYGEAFSATRRMKVTMLTVGFNRPDLTDHLLTSLETAGYDLKRDLHFILADNSSEGDGEIWTAKAHGVDYVDGRCNRMNFPVDKSETWGSTSHQSMLQFCIDNAVPKDTDYLVIADCDTYVKRRFDDVLMRMRRYQYVTAGVRSVDIEHPRIHPCFQILNYQHMVKSGIKYAGKLSFMKWDTGSEYYEKVKDRALLLYPDVAGGRIDCPLFTHYDSGTHGGHSYRIDRDIAATECTDYADLTLFIVNFGTQMLTEAAVTSFLSRHPRFSGEIIIMDNKPGSHFSASEIPYGNIRVIDNTNEQVVSYDDIRFGATSEDPVANYGSAKHSKCISYAISELVSTPICLISDSDVIYRRSVYGPYSAVRAGAVVAADIGRELPGTHMSDESRHSVAPRIFPCICLVNVEAVRKSGISFYDPGRMMMLNGSGFTYDTGASFFADILAKNLPYAQIRMLDYVSHLASASYLRKNWMSFLRANANYIVN